MQNGATFGQGRNGQGFKFDGIDDFVLVPSSPSLQPTQGITVESWVKFNSFNSGIGNYIVSKGYSNGNESTPGGYQLIVDETVLPNGTRIKKAGFGLGFGGGSISGGLGTSPIVTGGFYHLVGTYNGSMVKLYVNGVLENTFPETRPLGTNNDPLSIGRFLNANNPYNFNGVVDEVRIYSRALSATEVSNAYATGNNPICQLNSTSKLFDFDGDGKSDISVFRPNNGAWYIHQSTNGFTGLQFGLATDKLVPADYDGDGKTDVAVYRAGVWYLQRSQAGFTGIAFGDGNDIPQPADYDSDGRAEIAVFRPSNGYWYILNLVNNQFTAVRFGQTGDKPVAADYDGDGKTDVAVNRGGSWYIQQSQLGFTGVNFGDSNDKPVPADYDGDGKTDVAVFRPSNGSWYLLRSQAGFTGLAFGLGTDLPVAADYDGDGKADVAVFRSGNWYLNRSTSGFTGVAFGEPTDRPIPNAFVP